MSGIGETQDLKLTKVSDGTELLLTAATQKGGAPQIELGSTAKESQESGARDRIKIDTQHGGSGQKVARDERKYLIANGWMADEEGLLTPRGAKSEVVVTADADIFAGATRRGALFAVADEPYVAVTPKGIYEGISPTLKREPDQGFVFTGSHARFGNRVFFGSEDEVTAAGGAGAVRISAGDVVPPNKYNLDSGNDATVAANVQARKLTSGPENLGEGTPTPIQQTHLTTLDDTVRKKVFPTASIAPSADTLILVTVANEAAGGGELPVVTGFSLTWTQVATRVSEMGRLSVFRAMSVGTTPTPGAVTATFTAEQLACRIIVSEFANVDTSDTDGANAILQPTTDEGTGTYQRLVAVTLPNASPGKVGNSTFGAFFTFRTGSFAVNTSILPGNTSFKTGWIEISETSAGPHTAFTEWKIAYDPTVTAYTNNIQQNGEYIWLGIALELVQLEPGANVVSTFVTNTINPVGNKLLIAAVHNTLVGGAAALPSLAGNGVTWTEIDNQVFNGTEDRITLFRGMVASPTPGPVTITFGGVAQTSCSWSILEFDNVDTGGTHGSAAVVQSAKATATDAAPTVTLGAGTATNATLGAFASTGSDGITVGSGFSELHEVLIAGTLKTEWRDDFVQTVDSSTSVSVDWGGVAIEIKSVGASGRYETNEVSPTRDRLILAVIHNTSATFDLPDLSGNNLNWVQEATVTQGTERLTLFRAMATGSDPDPVPGIIAISFGGVAQTLVRWSIAEFSGALLGGDDGADAVVQSDTNSDIDASSLAVVLVALTDTANATFGAFAATLITGIDPGDDYEEIHDVAGSGAELMTEWAQVGSATVDASSTVDPPDLGLLVAVGNDASPRETSRRVGGTWDTPVSVTGTTGDETKLRLLTDDLWFTINANDNSANAFDSAPFGPGSRSKDGGDTWAATPQMGASGGLFDIARAIDGRLWALVHDTHTTYTRTAIYYSDDDGDTWTLSTTHGSGAGPETSRGWRIVCHPTDADTIAVVGYASGIVAAIDGYILYTTNRGVGWTANHNDDIELSQLGVIYYYDAVMLSNGRIIVVGPTQTGTVRCRCLYSDDYGVSWTEVYTAPSSTQLTHGLFVSGDESSVAFIISDNAEPPAGEVQLWLSTDGGDSFAEVGTPLQELNVRSMAATADTIYIATTSLEVYQLTPVSAAGVWTDITGSFPHSSCGDDFLAVVGGTGMAGSFGSDWIGIGVEIGRTATGAGDYADAGFEANYLTTVGSRMFRLRYDDTDELWYMSWTDQTGTDNPAWSTEYPVTGAKRSTADLVTLGPNPLAGLSVTNMPAEFLSMDTEGNYTPLVPEGLGITDLVAAAPFLNGQLFLLSGVSKVLWFRDLLDVALLDMNPSPPDDDLNLATPNSYGGVAGYADRIWAIANQQIAYGMFAEQDWVVNQFETLAADEIPLAIRVWPDSTQVKVDVLLRATADIRIRTYVLYNRFTFPTPDSDTKTFTSSIFQGTWISKEARRLRGYATVDSGSLTVEVLADGVSVGSSAITTSGPFAVDLQGIGRGLQVRLTCTNFMGTVELPLEIDFFYLPARKDILRVAVYLGEHSTRGGSLDMGNHLDDFLALSAAVADPEPWTMHFADGRDDWTVIPLDLGGSEVAPESKPANEQGVYWLTVQRL